MFKKILAWFVSLLFLGGVVQFGFYVSSRPGNTPGTFYTLKQELAEATTEVLRLQNEKIQLERKLTEVSPDPCGIFCRKLGSRQYYVQIDGHRIPMPILIKPQSRQPVVGEKVRIGWHPEGKALWVSIDPEWCTQK